jgi:hypothetical protein
MVIDIGVSSDRCRSGVVRRRPFEIYQVSATVGGAPIPFRIMAAMPDWDLTPAAARETVGDRRA